ncbi:MAG: hypothetical protein AABY87_08715 [bacterium]
MDEQKRTRHPRNLSWTATLILVLSLPVIAFFLSKPLPIVKTEKDRGGRILWEKSYGGGIGTCGQQTFDRGYIIAGYTFSYGKGKGDVYLIKTDENGNVRWEKTFGGAKWDKANSVQQTTDGGYILAGETDSYGARKMLGESDVYLIKTDQNGNAIWERTFGGRGDDAAYSVQQTTDGGYILAGKTDSYGAGESDVYLIRTDENGNAIWQKTFGGKEDDKASSILQTAEGGYILVGQRDFYGSLRGDVYLIKTDENGNVLWEKIYGTAKQEGGVSIRETSDGGYIILGHRVPGSLEQDIMLIKTNRTGEVLWEKTYHKAQYNIGSSVLQTKDDGYIIVGSTLLPGYDVVLVIKTDKNGNMDWAKIFGDTNWGGEGLWVQETAKGEYIIGGAKAQADDNSKLDVYLAKIK